MVQNNQGTGTVPSSNIVEDKPTKTYPFTVESIIVIHRVHKKSPLPSKDIGYNPADEYIYKIGSSFKAGTTKPLGLYIFEDEKERDKLMPQIIGISPSSVDFNKVLEKYWCNISISIPATGKRLDCSIEHLSETEWRPRNVEDYILWKYCLKYSGVANTEADIGKSNKINFVLWNEKEQKQKDLTLQKMKDAATMARISLREDQVKANSVLYVYNETVSKDADTNMLVLAKLAEENPAKFLGIVKDKDLLSKAFVQRAINSNILTQPVGSTLIGYEGNIIGSNISEAILFLKDAKNELIKMTLEAKLAAIDGQ
jgi:hypothetical protein